MTSNDRNAETHSYRDGPPFSPHPDHWDCLSQSHRDFLLRSLAEVEIIRYHESCAVAGIEKLANGLGVVNTDLLRKVRQHAGDVMRSGISADSTIRYEASLKGYHEFSTIVGKEPLYRSGWGTTTAAESHLAYQQHVVEYLSFLHLVNGNKAPTLRSKLSHLSWAHTSNGRDDPLKTHHATYVEAWMRALERREPRSAAGKRPATPDLLMMLFMNVSLQTYSAPVYCLSIWAAVLTAWAFMLRSREYVAVTGGGSRPCGGNKSCSEERTGTHSREQTLPMRSGSHSESRRPKMGCRT